MYCSVCGCKNSNNKNIKLRKEDISYHTFPTNPELLKIWIRFCRRKDAFNPKTGRICSEHFTADDFEMNFQFELGVTDKKRFRLKPGSKPTVYKATANADLSDRSTRVLARANKKLVKTLLDASTNELDFEEGYLETTASQDATESLLDANANTNFPDFEEVYLETNVSKDATNCQKCASFKAEMDTLRLKMKTMEEKCNKLILNETLLNNKIKSLQSNVEEQTLQKKNIEEKLATIFTDDQIRKLLSSDKTKQRWSEVDIAGSITLYSASSKEYNLLKEKKIPLPSVRTLQRWTKKLNLSSGILQPVVKILKASTDMDKCQKVCVLSFDEMKIKKSYCYQKATDTTLLPANYVQVAMLSGLMSKWQQPIFYSFDCKMTSRILKTILKTTVECGYTVVAIVSELGGANRSLYNELGISLEKPWFLYENEKIFVFADVPHLLKLLRNHFVDQGFLINGKEIKKNIIINLLSRTSKEITSTQKINTNYLKVTGTERQHVKFAAELFSHSIANAIIRAASSGYLKDSNWEECYSLFKLTNDWFDVMNVQTPNSDSCGRVHAYGLDLDSQNKILDEMSELMSSMKVIGKINLLPFQKGIIQSNTAIQLLFKDLESRFGFEYVLPYRLNMEELENTFAVLRGNGGLLDHPDREEFRCRLRSHILGHNGGVIPDAANVSFADTPDLESPLTGSMFQRIAWESGGEINDGNKDDEDLATLEIDSLENMAGFICHKLTNKIPDEENVASYSWSQPSPKLLNDLTDLDNIFKSFNGEGLVICPGYQQTLLELATDIDCDVEIKKLFFRASMYFRIRALNGTIEDLSKYKKRKYNESLIHTALSLSGFVDD